MNDAFSPEAADTLPFTGMTPYGRPSWSGLLQFSLVGIPLKAYPAVRTRDVPSAHLLHADCGSRLTYAKHCPVHGPIDSAAIVKGYEYGPGRHVIAQPEELDELRPVRDKALRLERFLTPGQLDPLLFAGRSLYLVPDGPAAEPGYGVLRTALAQRQRGGCSPIDDPCFRALASAQRVLLTWSGRTRRRPRCWFGGVSCRSARPPGLSLEQPLSGFVCHRTFIKSHQS